LCIVEALTPEERRQIMGNRGDVYERYYMPNFIDRDTLAIYLGTTRRDDLIQAVGHLERHEEAPDRLTDAQKREILNNPEIVSLIRRRARCAAKIKQCGYPTIKAAKGTKYFERHAEAQSEINCLKTKLSRKLLDKTIDEFHETVHSAEVERQMQGILPSSEVLNPTTIKYELEERATVARLLFQHMDDKSPEQVSQVRIQLVDALVQLCGRQETPHQFKASRGRKRLRDTDELDEPCKRLKVDNFIMDEEDPFADITLVDDTAVDSRAELCCPFCKWGDEEAGPRKKKYKFSRRDSRKRHVQDQHLTKQAIGEGFDCPYDGCTAFLGTAMHFLSHEERHHLLSHEDSKNDSIVTASSMSPEDQTWN
jgi:hypothetical protein